MAGNEEPGDEDLSHEDEDDERANLEYGEIGIEEANRMNEASAAEACPKPEMHLFLLCYTRLTKKECFVWLS